MKVKLTKPQRAALVSISKGHERNIHTRVLHNLEDKRLITWTDHIGSQYAWRLTVAGATRLGLSFGRCYPAPEGLFFKSRRVRRVKANKE